MTNLLKTLENEQIAKLTEGKSVPNFKAGDSLKVHVKVKEGERERIQVYEGICIARKNDGINSAFTVRKISFGEGVERVFPLYSPNVAKIDVTRIGKVRRAKLYFLRALRGRSARIADDLTAAAKAREEAKKNG
ncbi:MAG: 50S ribosomal protein L19 [Alphaproteobacteria bacterium]